MFAIGVGEWGDEDQLKSIVSQPHEQSLIKLDSYQTLEGSLLHIDTYYLRGQYFYFYCTNIPEANMILLLQDTPLHN